MTTKHILFTFQIYRKNNFANNLKRCKRPSVAFPACEVQAHLNCLCSIWKCI